MILILMVTATVFVETTNAFHVIQNVVLVIDDVIIVTDYLIHYGWCWCYQCYVAMTVVVSYVSYSYTVFDFLDCKGTAFLSLP